MQTNLEIIKNASLAKYTTFRVGGNADFLLYPLNQDGILQAINYCENYIILGNGSNVLVSDNGYRGAVISLAKMNGISIDGDILTCQSGALLSRIGNFCLNHELTGFEKLCGIPATIGGAICMNAGAYGGEISDILIESTCIDENGKEHIIKNHEFSYRHSIYLKNPKLVITSAKFKLKKAEKQDILHIMEDCKRKRQEKQPLEYPSAGSTFKRPEGYFAGKLIEDAGLKGFRVGGACVSEKHAGFVINDKKATCNDILQLISLVQKKVLDEFNVKLECEIKIIGE